MGREQQADGKAFEKVFEKMCRYCGLVPFRNPMACQYIGANNIRVIKSNLDYHVVERKSGRVGYFDCKNFSRDYFTYSQINPKQIDRAVVYNELKVPSGFVVFFRETNRIRFFSGFNLLRAGKGSRFTSGDGLDLGVLGELKLAGLFKASMDNAAAMQKIITS